MSKEEINEIRQNQVGQHITNIEKFSQVVLFDGIGKNQVRPTDYDGILELDNHYWFAFEVKGEGKGMPKGQSLSYTRTADKWYKCGDIAYVFVVEHNEEDPSKPILLKNCIIADVYHQGSWTKAKNNLTVKQGIEYLKKKYNITKI
jgi:hypothetical protein